MCAAGPSRDLPEIRDLTENYSVPTPRAIRRARAIPQYPPKDNLKKFQVGRGEDCPRPVLYRVTPFRQTTSEDALGLTVTEVSSATDANDVSPDQFPFGNPDDYVDDSGESLDALFNITADTFCKLRSRLPYLIRFKSLIDARQRDEHNRLIKPFHGKHTWSAIVKDLLHRDPRTLRYLFTEQKSDAQKVAERKKRQEKATAKTFPAREQATYDLGVTRTLAGQTFSNGKDVSLLSDYSVPKVANRLVKINAETLQNVASPQDRDMIARSIILELQKFLLPTEPQPPTEPPTRRKIKSPAGQVHIDELPPQVRAKVMSQISSKPVAAPGSKPSSNHDSEIVVGRDCQDDEFVQEDPSKSTADTDSAEAVSPESASECGPMRITDSPAVGSTRPLPEKYEPVSHQKPALGGPATDCPGHDESENRRDPESQQQTSDATAAIKSARAELLQANEEFLRKWKSSGTRLPPRVVFTPDGIRFEHYRFADPVEVIPQAVKTEISRGELLIPMKCPGSKCWFLPYAKEFLGGWRPKVIVEPFAGSAVVSLSLLSQGYADRLVLAELDDRRIAFWQRVFEPDFADFVGEWTTRMLALSDEEQRQFVLESLEEFKRGDPGMWALVYSRAAFSGKMDGGLMKKGDHGKGFMCRWRKDMVPMLRRIHELRDRIEVRHQDGLEVLREFDSPANYCFSDPPYSASESSKGGTLYQHYLLEHTSLFWLMSQWQGPWQMTYDLCWETLGCGRMRYLTHPEVEPWKSMQVKFQKVLMLSGANKKKFELVVTSRKERAA